MPSSSLGQLRPPTRDTGPLRPCQGPQLPCTPNTMCCGSSVAVLGGNLVFQSLSSSEMIIQIGKPKKNRNQAPEGQTNVKKYWGGTEREHLGRLIRSPELSRSLLCCFLCGRMLRLSALTSIELKLCSLPWVPPFTAYSRTSFPRLWRSSIPRLWTDVRPFVLGLLT